jgi:MFS family permease
MFDTMDQWLYVMARQPAITDLLGPGATPTDVRHYSGIVQGIFLFGWATGGLFFGIVGDRWGRTRCMAITVGMYAVFTGLSGLAQNWEMFAVFRFLTGLGIGGEFAAGAALIAEVFPLHARATALAIMQAASALGNMAAGFISLGVFTYNVSEDAWRWIFAIGFIPAVLVFAIRMFVHEPDQWKEAKEASEKGDIRLGVIWELLSPQLRRRTLCAVGLAAVGVVGFWGIGTFSPDLLRGAINPDNLPELKAQADKQASIAVIMQNFGAFFGVLAWGWLAQRVGRKPAFATSLICCLIIVPVTFHFTTSFALALVFYPIMGFFLTSLFGGYAVYFPELFPTRLRATGTGVCYNVARYIAIAGPPALAFLSANGGIAWGATKLSAVFVIGLVILYFAPETKDKELPE